jgi:hypothetical protein
MVTSPKWGILDGTQEIVGQYLLIAVETAIDSQELNAIFKSVESSGESLDLNLNDSGFPLGAAARAWPTSGSKTFNCYRFVIGTCVCG